MVSPWASRALGSLVGRWCLRCLALASPGTSAAHAAQDRPIKLGRAPGIGTSSHRADLARCWRLQDEPLAAQRALGPFGHPTVQGWPHWQMATLGAQSTLTFPSARWNRWLVGGCAYSPSKRPTQPQHPQGHRRPRSLAFNDPRTEKRTRQSHRCWNRTLREMQMHMRARRAPLWSHQQ
jgi:hypothetical protein